MSQWPGSARVLHPAEPSGYRAREGLLQGLCSQPVRSLAQLFTQAGAGGWFQERGCICRWRV